MRSFYKLVSFASGMMMDEPLNIYVDRLKNGHTEAFALDLDPSFLDIHEAELSFNTNVCVEGEAYLAEDNLILHCALATTAVLPCLICSAPVVVEIKVENLYHMEPLDEIKSGVFAMGDVLREAILLETPGFAECHGGKCPLREQFKHILKPQKEGNREDDLEDRHHPFAHL